MLTHLKPHLYLTLKQIKMLEAKQGILEKAERLRIDAEIKEGRWVLKRGSKKTGCESKTFFYLERQNSSFFLINDIIAMKI